ncbi:hypothetical protein [Pseudobacteriovorax antillogorgiicola]|uniref:Lipoprotein n=1 Tax=Pseudobacteriovorax antillogorgiicola TaxID=1513793 RepID=A0A1Y6B703_9BACT|nr:hypothetical protein [Pseudobacteriovorax antillogorgiicola]TCS58659.1 hypothetical protein EDD56_102172 [Pseudobacteriovorax antillogorgiicola]SME96224.1 hypothetical protein SAMN06296036_102271 [Pseudobacteriovorax antillogorgiicola]
MKAILIAVVAAISLGSCSMKQMVLNNLDWLALREIDSLFDLASEQKDFLEPHIERNHRQLKQSISLKVAAILKTVSQKSQSKKLEKNDLRLALREFQAMRRDFLIENSPIISRFFKSLSNKQLDHWEEKLKERDEPWEELAEAENFGKELKQYREDQLDKLSYWFGDLKEPQIKVVESHSINSQEEVQNLLAARRKKRVVLVTQVRTKSETELKAFFDQWAYQPNLRSEIAKVEGRDWSTWFVDYWWDLYESLDSEQRQQFTERLDEIAIALNTFHHST